MASLSRYRWWNRWRVIKDRCVNRSYNSLSWLSSNQVTDAAMTVERAPGFRFLHKLSSVNRRGDVSIRTLWDLITLCITHCHCLRTWVTIWYYLLWSRTSLNNFCCLERTSRRILCFKCWCARILLIGWLIELLVWSSNLLLCPWGLT
jgi:hypothetical protein